MVLVIRKPSRRNCCLRRQTIQGKGRPCYACHIWTTNKLQVAILAITPGPPLPGMGRERGERFLGKTAFQLAFFTEKREGRRRSNQVVVRTFLTCTILSNVL